MRPQQWLGDFYGKEGLAAFWSNVDVKYDTECWLWRRTAEKNRYGSFAFKKFRETSHRIALELKLGQPLKQYALHSCDNPPCCNPNHLREGSQGENCRDTWSRGRQSHNPYIGKGMTRKVTDEQIEAICELRASGVPTYLIARAVGISGSSVQKYYQSHKQALPL